MKSNFKSVSVLLLSLAVLSCGSNEKQAAKEDHGHEDHGQKQQGQAAGESTSVKIKDENLNAVYQHYVHLTKALVNENSSEARIAANAIETGARQMQGAEAIAGSASKISGTSDINEQRNLYSMLSNQMIDMVKKSGVSSGEVYVDYCPMAMNDKGAYWLSNEKEILNPYFGKKMLNCGEVKESIR